MRLITTLFKGVEEMIYPHVCEICGSSLPDTRQFICRRCLESRFEYARLTHNPDNAEILLPENIECQYALWKFDKGGYLQDLLHALKYHRLYGVGTDLGRALAVRLKKYLIFNDLNDVVLVPVPLHPRKEKKRGYNQAYYLAVGMSEVLRFSIVEKNEVIRTKNTRTQTGFSLEKRKQNIHQAFQVKEKSAINGKTCIIVDDVFTTGATTFELADELEKAGARKIMITTVAEA